MDYMDDSDRYNKMIYRRCGKSGLKLPVISLGMWRNFGDTSSFSDGREMILGAFNLGITHFDLADTYGPAVGAAEVAFGKIAAGELKAHRDELIVSTKAGFCMNPGPYGDGGSRKHIISSLDHSLTRMNLDYVDIFYHHCPDSETPMEETAEALARLVHQGKALHIGISNYTPEQTEKMIEILDGMGIHLLIHQLSHSMLVRHNEAVFDVLEPNGVGSIVFSALAQGLLSKRYLHGTADESRMKCKKGMCTEASITLETMEKIAALNVLAGEREQSLSQMALAWVLQRSTSVIIGASRFSQLKQNCQTTQHLDFAKEELDKIEAILNN